MIAVDSAGHVYATKCCNDSFNGPGIGFDDGIAIDKLSADGAQLLYAFQFAQTPTNAPASCRNSGDSSPLGIAADNAGHVWVAGATTNICMPTTPGAFQRTIKPSDEAGFVVKLDTTRSGAASIVYSTFLFGSRGGDFINALAVDSSGNAYVSGVTTFSSPPHGKTFGTATSADNGSPGFVTKLNASGSALVFSTLIHGAGEFGGISGFRAPSGGIPFPGIQFCRDHPQHCRSSHRRDKWCGSLPQNAPGPLDRC